MARPSKNAVVDYTVHHVLTHGLLARAACPDGAPFVLVRDDDKKGLRVRITKAGGKYWQFETRIKGKLFTRALGEWPGNQLQGCRDGAALDRCGLHRGGEIVQETPRPCRFENPGQRSSSQLPFTQEGSIITMITDSNLQLSSGHRPPRGLDTNENIHWRWYSPKSLDTF